MRSRLVLAAIVAALVVGAAPFVGAQSGKAKPTLGTQDYIDIQQLYARYALLIDSGDAEGWAGTFTPDGVFNNSSRGHDALVQFVHTWRERQNGANLRHWYSNLVITPSADGATGAVYMMLLDISKRPPTPTASYLYDDALVKTAAGWRFKSRVLHSDAPPASTK